MAQKHYYFIKTFGCQMNESDSERIAGWYENNGWQQAKNYQVADEVVINSCSVRASAEHRVYGLINNLKLLKLQNPKANKPKIVLTGCMLRLPLRTLKEKLPGVDEFVRLEHFLTNSKIINHKSSFVPISNGCNNFCSYCVVPYARGREKSREYEEIICEVQELVKRGVREITLLGQNVNSWGKDFVNSKLENQKSKPQLKSKNFEKIKTPFAILLNSLNNIEGLEKITFLTSNPWDLNDEIIEAMSLPKIDRYFHLPLQSGDDEILKRMNRKYTAEDYLSLIDRIRKKIPEIQFGTDIIVGFPGETEEQFQHTVELCRKVGFAKAYINKYSPRSGTTAYKLGDTITALEKKRRWLVLEKLINQKTSAQKSSKKQS
jgi:tRNA-2-methylthio-N6-dimethylallyladenosine synthase